MNRKPSRRSSIDFLDDRTSPSAAAAAGRPFSRRSRTNSASGTPHGLDRSQHVAAVRQKVPSGRAKGGAADPSPFVDTLQSTGGAILEHLAPDDVAVAPHNTVGGTVLVRFVGEQRRVNATEHHVGAALAREPSQRISAERIARMNADPDDIAGPHRVEIQRLEGFVDDDGIAIGGGRRRRQHIQPARRDHRRAERHITRID